MGSATDYAERVTLDLWLGPTTKGVTSGAITVPTTVYIGLYTTIPADDATGGVEVTPSGSAYARISVTNSAANWPVSTTSSGITTKANGAIIQYATATATWGTVVGFGIFDALTVGNLLFYGALQTSQVVSSGQAPSFAVGALSLTCD